MEAAQQCPAVVLDHLFLDRAGAGTLGDDRGEALVLRRRLQHHLATDREADAADAGRVDVGPVLEEVDGGVDVTLPAPAPHVGVAVADTLAPAVEQQHAVAVADQHPGVCLRALAAREGDHGGAVPGGHVPALEVQPVAGGERDVLVVGPQIGRRDLGAAHVRGEVHRRERTDDLTQEQERGNALGGATGVAAGPAAVPTPRLPQEPGGETHEHQPGDGRGPSGEVVAGGTGRERVVAGLDGAHHDPCQPDGEREDGPGAGADAGVRRRGREQQGQRDESAHEVVTGRDPGVRLEEVVVRDVEHHERGGREEHPVTTQRAQRAIAPGHGCIGPLGSRGHGLVEKGRGHVIDARSAAPRGTCCCPHTPVAVPTRSWWG